MSLQALLFMLAYFIGLLYAVVGAPIAGLYVYILNYFLDAPGRWWGAYLPGLRWSLIAAVVTLAAIFMHRRNADAPRPLAYWAFRFYILYVVWMWIQTPWVVDPQAHANGLNFMTKFILVIYMTTVLADELVKIERILFAMIAGGAYLGFLTFTSFRGGRLDGIGGAGIDDSNTLGLAMAAISLCAGVLYHVSRGRAKWFAACVLPFTLNTIVAAGSRASFLALACGGLALFWFRPPRETARLLLYGVLAAALFLSLASEYFWERMETMLSATKENVEMERSAASRLVVASSQWRIFLDHPLGAGHKGTAALSYSYIPLEFHASQGGRASHNTLLSVLVDQGIVGIVIWTGMLAAIWRMCHANHRVLRRAGDRRATWINATIAAAMFAIFVGGMFSQQVKLEINYWLMSLLMAMSSWVSRTYPGRAGARSAAVRGGVP